MKGKHGLPRLRLAMTIPPLSSRNLAPLSELARLEALNIRDPGRCKFLVTLLFFLLIWSPLAFAVSDMYSFSTPEKKARFQHVLSELRCLVCQNQTLADSNAPVAQDLRREVAKLVEKYDADQQVIDFLVQRYGDFVLYNPPLTKTTYLLWFGPGILLLIGFIVLFRFMRK
jgi:cytochrome c-type biogenesis protein CcmH